MVCYQDLTHTFVHGTLYLCPPPHITVLLMLVLERPHQNQYQVLLLMVVNYQKQQSYVTVEWNQVTYYWSWLEKVAV